MDGPSKSSQKYLLLQVWCALLTVAMLIMAAFLASIKPQLTEVSSQVTQQKHTSLFIFIHSFIHSFIVHDRVSTATPENVSPTIRRILTLIRPVSQGKCFCCMCETKETCVLSPAAVDGHSWEESPPCHSCSLSLRNDSIHFTESSLYFLYAQVTFTNRPKNRNQTRSLILIRNPVFGRSLRKLVEGRFPATTESSVWVAKIVRLKEGDSVSLVTSDDLLNDSTFWGAYKLH
ncbi:uncharacterized protein LOC131471334 [Solea solea]|uniref:uncharacterized protein LOC131471334 n=1 Tax=Solea solea TaxID=90069 RepID=UPI00272D950E|nr:uncharacterized protein LOC131471334 [Solea solea]